MLSQRIQRIEESGIRKVFELASQNRGEFYNFSIGQPHFKTPEKLKKALAQAAQDDYNSYTSTSGLPELREKIALKLKKENNIQSGADNIIVTNGVSGGLFLAFSSLLNPGDEVILPDPYFVLYKQLLDFLGVKTVFWDTYPDFHLDSQKLKKLITPKTKAVIINSPNNPTGMVYSRKELEEVAKISEDRGLYVISDEIYEKFDYEDKFFSIGSVYEKTITLNGFSKSHLVTGWRVGYVQAPGDIIEAMNKLQQYTFVCASSVAQQALNLEWETDLSEYIESYKQNRDFIVSELDPAYNFYSSEGSYYFFIKNPKEKKDFISELIKNKVLVIPGEVFSQKEGYFRLSFAVEKKTLKKGVEILNKLAK